MSTEQKLKRAFDFQRFEKNAGLEKLISESEKRFAGELSDESLSHVNAAGEVGGSDPAGEGSVWKGMENENGSEFEKGSRYWEGWQNRP